MQTIAKMPHNYHAYNQRVFEEGCVRFAFLEERRQCHNKQSKPSFYVFGNLVVTRTASLLSRSDLFGTPSMGLEIDPTYALDVDTISEFAIAEWYVSSGRVHPTASSGQAASLKRTSHLSQGCTGFDSWSGLTTSERQDYVAVTRKDRPRY